MGDDTSYERFKPKALFAMLKSPFSVKRATIESRSEGAHSPSLVNIQYSILIVNPSVLNLPCKHP